MCDFLPRTADRCSIRRVSDPPMMPALRHWTPRDVSGRKGGYVRLLLIDYSFSFQHRSPHLTELGVNILWAWILDLLTAGPQVVRFVAGKGEPVRRRRTACNPCLDAAKACNLNDTCKRQRSAYIAICTKATPPQLSLSNQEPCSRKRCQKALRQFFERVSWEFSYPLLFCSCRDQACANAADRPSSPPAPTRRDTSPPAPRSRLADFHMNCQVTPHTVTGCPHDNYHGCLMAYVGLIGSDVTPNYSDNSPANITISLWCTCRGTGNQERDCDAFHRDFTHNSCLRNAIHAFGYGAEGVSLPVTEPVATFFPPVQPPIIAKPVPSLHGNALQPIDSACMFSTCANLQDSGRKCIPSDDFDCEEGFIESRNTDRAESGSGQSQRSLCVAVGVSILAELLLAVLY
ncbi:GDNF family receptor alpha-2 [Merluccius polli]|uniref:GDNF family receptor alpha-2 n=1 Tax=Merluccius polli TaxID=89951 RepID=A0AA47NVU5_MERPO|nr:GDNF family receptor alpha-2 [Merluccius polli]